RHLREFPISPDRTIGKKLLLPDRYSFLQCVDCVTASLEGSRTMRRTHSNENASFADLETTQTVDHRHTSNRVVGVKVRGDLLHFGESHGLVRFIFQIYCHPAVGVVANAAVKRGDSAILVCTNMCGYLRIRYAAARDFDPILEMKIRHGVEDSAAAYRRQESHFVTRRQGRVPRGKLAIARRNQRSPEFAQLRAASRGLQKKIFDHRAVKHSAFFFESPEKLFQSAKIEHFSGHLRFAGLFNPESHLRVAPPPPLAHLSILGSMKILMTGS